MKILIFCNSLAAGKGGMEKTAINLANYLSSSHDLFVGYSSRYASRLAYKVDEKVKLVSWEKPRESIVDYRLKLEAVAPDLIIYFGATCHALNIVPAFVNLGAKIIMHEGSNPDRVIKNNWADSRGVSLARATWERQAVYSFANAIRFTVKDYIRSLPKFLRVRTQAFPNAFEAPKGCISSVSNKRIINIGGLKPNKNLIPLLKAFDVFSREQEGWELHIFSSSPKNPKAEKYYIEIDSTISALGLQDSVKFNGESENIWDEYRKSSIHVITSLSEGLSNAVCEAMCVGVPTIGFEGVPGVDGVVEHETNGLLAVNDRQCKSLYRSIKRLAEDKSLREKMSKNSISKASEYHPEYVFKRWDALIEEVVSLNDTTNSLTERHFNEKGKLLFLEANNAIKDKIFWL